MTEPINSPAGLEPDVVDVSGDGDVDDGWRVGTPYGPARVVQVVYGQEHGFDQVPQTYRVVVESSNAEKLIKAESLSHDPADLDAPAVVEPIHTGDDENDHRTDLSARTSTNEQTPAAVTGQDRTNDAPSPAPLLQRPSAAERARTVAGPSSAATVVLDPSEPSTARSGAVAADDREYSDAELMAGIDAAIATGDMWVFDPKAETERLDEATEQHDQVQTPGKTSMSTEKADSDAVDAARRAQQAIREVQARQTAHEAEQQAQEDDLARWHADDAAADDLTDHEPALDRR